jgi:uncharacterized protein (DUF3820 family)
MKMPFGKHEGVPLHDLPWTYLQWLSEQEWIHTKRPTLAAAIRAELAMRDGLGGPGVPARVVELIEGGFRATAMKHHPDHGGSNEAMREVITARDWLRTRIATQVLTNGVPTR